VAGLCEIHHYKGEVAVEEREGVNYGRHGDIKPENILLFSDPDEPLGRLVLSDFGSGQFNSRASASQVPNERARQTRMYQPPESDIEGGTISRSSDIWTLGCVFLEFTTWLLGGYSLVEDFENSRMSPYIYGNGIRFNIYFDVARHRGKHFLIVKEAVAKVCTLLMAF
jgi:serine/threonine protein kinase